MFQVSRDLLDQCFRYGIEAYPEEACGLLSGPVESSELLTEVHSMPNMMNQYHAENPELYPRTNRNAYMIDPLAQRKLERELKKQGQRVKVIFHSHPDVGVYFSAKDQADALWNGEPRYPGVAYLVCGIKNHQRDGAILVAFNPENRQFEITSLE